MSSLLDDLRAAEAALEDGDLDGALLRLTRLRSAARQSEQALKAAEAHIGRYQVMMARTLEVTRALGAAPVASQLLDGMLTLVAARRAFLGVFEGEAWRFLAARDHEGRDLPDPHALTSSSIIRRMREGEAPHVAANASAQDTWAAQPSVHALHLRSVACLPLSSGERPLGFVYLDDPRTRGLFDAAALDAVEAWLPLVSACVARALAEEPEGPLPGVITRSPVLRAELSELARVARFDLPVLLVGETGTGKSLVARRLHAASQRAAGPFVHINCGAIPEGLIESELFGHRRGAFTGANADRAGRLEAAHQGTLFLDELDSLPPACQVKLLVALQERHVTRLGDTREVPIDVRIVSATNADPAEAMATGRLREDFYYRLAVFTSRLPPLRERPEDIPLLASTLLERTRQRHGLPPLRLSDEALAELEAHDWPGNVRELENTLDRAAVLARDGLITSALGPRRAQGPRVSPAASGPVDALELAAARLVQAMAERPALRDPETLDALAGLVLLEAVRQAGGRDEGFTRVGLEHLLKGRNHHRRLKRELERVTTLYQRLGAAPPGPPD